MSCPLVAHPVERVAAAEGSTGLGSRRTSYLSRVLGHKTNDVPRDDRPTRLPHAASPPHCPQRSGPRRHRSPAEAEPACMNPSQAVVALAAEQEGVISRRQLYGLGVTRWQVVANLRAARWQRVGDQSVCVHTGPLSQRAEHWAAVFQGGPRAQLDGASALIESGLVRFEVDRVRVSVPRGAKVRRSRRYDIRQTRRWCAEDLVVGGVPRTPPAVAAVRAALWAKTDR